MTKLLPEEAFQIIGCKYDYGMRLVRTGKLDGTFYRLGRRVIFMKEKLELWQENQLGTHQDKAGLSMAR
ncbi:hypothetical protein [Desulfosporosinus sp.]|uniref:hypothetical protein n=1 Tax=Desulfosporosinus sp. TaxID=157907 RepID=UPI002602CE45|nr:hypothetical protein [Desulfosporosinus sp.]MCO5384438.1 hypothetical protein [Desulfosporosinus sp.]